MRFEGTATYVAGDELKTAVNAAIALERPLLVKGEPGTGKTLLAQEIAGALGAPFIAWHIKSTTRAQQGLYEYDAVSRLRDSQLGDPRVSEIANYIRRGKLWEAFTSPVRPVLLIDEIDKADIEFPNDLLLELDQMEFHVYETGETVRARVRPDRHHHLQQREGAARRVPAPLLLSLHPLSRRGDNAQDRRVALSVDQAAADRGGDAIVLRAARDAGTEEETDHFGAARLAQASAQRGHFARDAARARREETDPAAARRAAEERAGRPSVREAGISKPPGAIGATPLSPFEGSR